MPTCGHDPAKAAPGVPFGPGQCRRCWLRLNHPRYGADPPPRITRVVQVGILPCRFEGDDLTGPERDARGLDHRRRWLFCLHADTPRGEVTCKCRGCGTGCPGYSPAGV